MDKLKIAVIAGTSEATELIKKIEKKFEVTAFTATAYGAEILSDCKCKIYQGRLDEDGFRNKLNGSDAVADMSHPFAEIVSAIVKKVCSELGIKYFRGGREQLCYDYNRITYVDSKEEAAELLKVKSGNIFLTTGIKTLGFYETDLRYDTDRIWARVLESEESRSILSDFRINIIYSKLPVSEKDTDEVIKKNDIKILVTKDSGKRGGLYEKIEAAKKNNAEVIIIRSPENGQVNSADEIYNHLLNLKW